MKKKIFSLPHVMSVKKVLGMFELSEIRKTIDDNHIILFT